MSSPFTLEAIALLAATLGMVVELFSASRMTHQPISVSA
jgi:hypothetical protein